MGKKAAATDPQSSDPELIRAYFSHDLKALEVNLIAIISSLFIGLLSPKIAYFWAV